MHLNLNFLCQLTAQIIDVDSCAAIHLRRIFACEKADSQSFPLVRSKTPSSIAAALDAFHCGFRIYRASCADSTGVFISIPPAISANRR
jgi:hypothetical protein